MQSTDAGSWERLGALPEQITDGFLSLAGSQEGYVLLTNGSTGRTSVWFSADGCSGRSDQWDRCRPTGACG